jgi:hypothetical protein
MTMRPRIALALLLATAATAAAGCGAASIESAVDPVAQAAATTAGAGGVRFTMHATISAGGQSVPMDGSGVYDQKSRQASLTAGFTAPGIGSLKLDEIVMGSTFYLHMPPQLAGQVPGGKPWIKIDLNRAAKGMGIDLGALQQAQGEQVGDYLAYLKAAGNAHRVGTETVDGFVTTHYAATIEFSKAAQRVGGAAGKSLRRLQTLTGTSSTPVDVWVDGQRLVRRIEMRYAVQRPTVISTDMRMDFVRYHVAVNVTPPPADQVLDASDLGSAPAGS